MITKYKLNNKRLPKAISGSLIASAAGTGLGIVTSFINNAKQKKEQARMEREQRASLFNSQLAEDNQLLENFNSKGNIIEEYLEGGNLPLGSQPNLQAIQGGTLIPTGENTQQAVGNTHSTNNIDGNYGIDIAKNGQPIANVENGEIIKDEEKVYSNQLKYDINNTFSDKMRKLTNQENKLNIKLENTSDGRSKNSIERQLSIIDMAKDNLFKLQEKAKEQIGNEKLANPDKMNFDTGNAVENILQGDNNLFNPMLKAIPNPEEEMVEEQEMIEENMGMPKEGMAMGGVLKKYVVGGNFDPLPLNPKYRKNRFTYSNSLLRNDLGLVDNQNSYRKYNQYNPNNPTYPIPNNTSNNYINKDSVNTNPISYTPYDISKYLNNTGNNTTIPYNTNNSNNTGSIGGNDGLDKLPVAPDISTGTETGNNFESVTNTSDKLSAGKFNSEGITSSLIQAAPAIANMFMRTPKVPVPLLNRTEKMKTTINVNPQLSAINNSTKSIVDSVLNNTSNSNSARAAITRARLEGTKQSNDILANKENQETQLENQQALNRQTTLQGNNNILNKYATDNFITQGDKRSFLSNNLASISTAAQNYYTGKELNKASNDVIENVLSNDPTGEKSSAYLKTEYGNILKNPKLRQRMLLNANMLLQKDPNNSHAKEIVTRLN